MVEQRSGSAKVDPNWDAKLETVDKFPSRVTRVPESHGQKNQPRIADCAFLLGIIIVSAFPYQFGLGLYLDDW